MFDFTPLEEVGVLCVNCKMPEESYMFWNEVCRNYQHVLWGKSTARSVVMEGRARFGSELCFKLELSNGRVACGWDQRSYFEEEGYRIFDFYDLMRSDCDLGEFSEDTFDLSTLFGGDETRV